MGAIGGRHSLFLPETGIRARTTRVWPDVLSVVDWRPDQRRACSTGTRRAPNTWAATLRGFCYLALTATDPQVWKQ